MKLANRCQSIDPFHVMSLLAHAQALEAKGRDIIHMEVGEPGFPTPDAITRAGMDALQRGKTGYSPALGIAPLRAAIAQDYASTFNCTISPHQIGITTGASAALTLVMAALIEPGDQVLMTDPCYPCNRHFVRCFGGQDICIPTTAEQRFQPTARDILEHASPRVRAVLLASPANPTGTSLSEETLSEILDVCRQRGWFLVIDEIYHRLVYDRAPSTALSLGSDVIVINSFSKYFQMTGWRLGWVVAPLEMMAAIERFAQNLYLAPPTPAQIAALAAFNDDVLNELETRRIVLGRRRQRLINGLLHLGFSIPASPDGAFYIYADASKFCSDTFTWASWLLDEYGVACTPGRDFGTTFENKYLRFAYSVSEDRIDEALTRIARAIASPRSV